jgi:glycerol-3-phosphate acyltransferase PlsY
MESNLLLALVLSYLLGSIPFAQIIAKTVKGIDLRKVGSLNVGARNLTRSVGLGWGVLGGLLDFSKGYFSLILAQRLGLPYPTYLLAGTAAMVGHNWPIWLRFRGGKGLATAAGIAVHLGFPQALASFVIWGLVMHFSKNVIVASVASFATLLAILSLTGAPIEIIIFVLGLATLALLAALPDMIRTMRTAGAVEEYFRDPEIMYKKQKH